MLIDFLEYKYLRKQKLEAIEQDFFFRNENDFLAGSLVSYLNSLYMLRKSAEFLVGVIFCR